MTIKYNKWDDVSIQVYEEICDATSIENEVERTIATIAVLCDTTIEEVEKLPLIEMNRLVREASWINGFDFDKKHKPKVITTPSFSCDVTNKVEDMTVAQYADFQAIFGSGVMQDILSVFLIPTGKEYGDGYDIEELREEIYKNVSITQAQSIIYFFVQSSLSSFRTTLTSLEKDLKKEKKKEKKMETRARIQTIQQNIQKMKDILGWH